MSTSNTPIENILEERNVEIKARISSDEEFNHKVEIAKKLTSTSGELIVQKDVFFHSPKGGRLKLRYLQNEKSQLIFYDRPNISGPKLSKFNKISVDEPEILEKMLTASNGTRGILRKNRLLFLYQGNRIHLDKVENLGNFVEFEICLNPKQSIEDGKMIAKELMIIFSIEENNLMTGAYFDEFVKNPN